MLVVSIVKSCRVLRKGLQSSMITASEQGYFRCLSTQSNASNSVGSNGSKAVKPGSNKIDCSQPTGLDDDELEELEDMFVQGPAGMEWNGPTRGGRRPEPTRYGDWERKGRTSDF